MKNKANISLFLVFLGISQFAFSTAYAEICFKDMSELKKNEAEIPELFKKVPLYIAGESALGGAAINIRALGNVFSYTYFMRKGWVKSNNEGEIKEVCVNKENSGVEIKLNNGTNFKGTYADSDVKIQGITLKKITKAEFDKTVAEKYQLGTASSSGSAHSEGPSKSSSDTKKTSASGESVQ